MALTVGIDGVEIRHDVIMNTEGTVLVRARIETGATNSSNFSVSHGGTAEDTPVAIETDKNLLVVALADASFTVYPINRRAVARYRELYGQVGGKSDPVNSAILAKILRTDREAHRQPPNTPGRLTGGGTEPGVIQPALATPRPRQTSVRLCVGAVLASA